MKLMEVYEYMTIRYQYRLLYFTLFLLLFAICLGCFPSFATADQVTYNDEYEDEDKYRDKNGDEGKMSFKECVYQHLDAFETPGWNGEIYPILAEVYPEEYKYISQYGIESVPYILQYILEPRSTYDPTAYWFMLVSAYEMLGVQGAPQVHWLLDGYPASVLYVYQLTEILLDYINENGLRPIYPFLSAEEAAANQDKIIRELELKYTIFKWYLHSSLKGHQYNISFITVFGEYAVPHILDYILSHEGSELTSDEEMSLGVLLHIAYRMLGVETTAKWHMPAEPVASTTDPFPYAHELVAHLGEYGLEAVPQE